ncbi:MAG: hypothetical protein ACLQL2_06445 [Methylovirgula sp.]
MHKEQRRSSIQKFASKAWEPDFVALHAGKMRNEALTRRAPVCAPHAPIWMTFMDVNLTWLATATVLALIALIVALPDVELVSDDDEAID